MPDRTPLGRGPSFELTTRPGHTSADPAPSFSPWPEGSGSGPHVIDVLDFATQIVANARVVNVVVVDELVILKEHMQGLGFPGEHSRHVVVNRDAIGTRLSHSRLAAQGEHLRFAHAGLKRLVAGSEAWLGCTSRGGDDNNADQDNRTES
jgi:hypothetical protein